MVLECIIHNPNDFIERVERILMKERMIVIGICIFKYMLRGIYFWMKLLPMNPNKILFCSRQRDSVGLDYLLLQNELSRRNNTFEYVNICRRIEKNLKEYILFLHDLLRSMYHLATCKVCIIDSYWPTVSLLNHKKTTIIIQAWHSIGKIKKSGYATIGKKSGRNKLYAEALCMHKNYDYIISGAEVWNHAYCESFNISEEKLLNYGLPRVDYLIDNKEKIKLRFASEFKAFDNKKIILYAPTFRKRMQSHNEELFEYISMHEEEIVLLVKPHMGQYFNRDKVYANVHYIDNWTTMDLLLACDYLITDYSAVALEAAVCNCKTLYWLYDYEEYVLNNGLNLNLLELFPTLAYRKPSEIIEIILYDNYDNGEFQKYRKKYLPQNLGNATKKFADLIIKEMDR